MGDMMREQLDNEARAALDLFTGARERWGNDLDAMSVVLANASKDRALKAERQLEEERAARANSDREADRLRHLLRAVGENHDNGRQMLCLVCREVARNVCTHMAEAREVAADAAAEAEARAAAAEASAGALRAALQRFAVEERALNKETVLVWRRDCIAARDALADGAGAALLRRLEEAERERDAYRKAMRQTVAERDAAVAERDHLQRVNALLGAEGERCRGAYAAREEHARALNALRAAEERATRLEAALRPFAALADKYDPARGWTDSQFIGSPPLTVAHLRAARAALSAPAAVDPAKHPLFETIRNAPKRATPATPEELDALDECLRDPRWISQEEMARWIVESIENGEHRGAAGGGDGR